MQCQNRNNLPILIFQHLTVLYKRQIPSCFWLSKLFHSRLADYSQPFRSPQAVPFTASRSKILFSHSPRAIKTFTAVREPFPRVVCSVLLWPQQFDLYYCVTPMPKVDPMCLSDSVSFGTEKSGQHVNGNGKNRIPIDRNRSESMPIFGRLL